MVVLLIYLAGLGLLTWLLRGWRKRPRTILIVGYNYLFVIPLYFMALLPEGAAPGEMVSLLLRCAYIAPDALVFKGKLEYFSDPFITLLFFLMSVYTVRAVLVLFFQRAVTAIVTRWRMFAGRETYLICGQPEDARSMIREVRAHKPRAAIVYIPGQEGDDDPAIDTLVEVRPWAQFLRPHKKYRIILLPDEKNNNLQQLTALEAVAASWQGAPPLQVTAFVDNDILRHESLSYEHLDAYLVSREQLAVRSFINGTLPLKRLQDQNAGAFTDGIYRPARPFSLCILGLTSLSREFLLTTWENTAFETDAPDGRGLDALIVDENAARKKVSFCLDVPQLTRQPGIQWLDTAPDSEAGLRAIRERLESLDQILVATEDTRWNIRMGTRLLRLFRLCGMAKTHPQLVIALYEKADGSIEFLSKEADGAFLQNNSALFSYFDIIDRAMDSEAVALHQTYCKDSGQPTPWTSLNTFTKDSNRTLYWDVPNKAALAGDTSGLSAAEREAVAWKIAVYEHQRWNAFHYTHGWTAMSPEELTEQERAAFKTKHADVKRHICLVPWEALDGLPQKRPGLLKIYDYNNVCRALGWYDIVKSEN